MSDWTVIGITDEREVDDNLLQLRNILIYCSIGGMLIAVVFSTILTMCIIKELNTIKNAITF